MKGTISKIHEPKASRNGNVFTRLEFKLEDGSWAKTDICPDYRNYARWRPFLAVGTALDGLILKREGEVNADSYPVKIKADIEGRWFENPDGSMVFKTADQIAQEIEQKNAKVETGLIQQKLI